MEIERAVGEGSTWNFTVCAGLWGKLSVFLRDDVEMLQWKYIRKMLLSNEPMSIVRILRCSKMFENSNRVQTTLLVSMCHALVHALKNHFLWHWYCGKKRIKFGSVVFTLNDNDARYHSVQNDVDSLGCTSWVHNILTTVMVRILFDKSTDHAI